MLGFLSAASIAAPALPNPAQHQQPSSTIVLQSPAEFSTFARILVPAAATAAASTKATDDEQLDARPLPASAAIVEALNTKGLGALGSTCSFVAMPFSGAAARVVCHKAMVAKVYKALQQGQSALGLRMGDVPSSVQLGLMPPPELHQAIETAIERSMVRSGWMHLGSCWLSADVLSAANPQTAAEVRIQVQLQLPSTVLLHVEAARKQPMIFVLSLLADSLCLSHSRCVWQGL
jgi:hypothetical protein